MNIFQIIYWTGVITCLIYVSTKFLTKSKREAFSAIYEKHGFEESFMMTATIVGLFSLLWPALPVLEFFVRREDKKSDEDD